MKGWRLVVKLQQLDDDKPAGDQADDAGDATTAFGFHAGDGVDQGVPYCGRHRAEQ